MKTLQERREGMAKHCQHFNGVQNNACNAGVTYESLPSHKSMREFVCFGEVAGCDKYVAAGMDAVLKREEESKVEAQNYVKARKAITDRHGKERGVRGTINCPVCNTGALHYSIAGYNGHIHANCSTENCMSWME